MIIDFGLDEFQKNNRPLADNSKGRVMEIPDYGKLPQIPSDIISQYLDSSKAEPRVCDLHNYTNVKEDIFGVLQAVRFNIKGRLLETNEIILFWAQQPRSKWIAAHHYTWHTPETRVSEFDHAPIYKQEAENGPYTLDDYCRDMLFGAYRLNEGDIERSKIAKTTPQELMQIYIRKEVTKGYDGREEERQAGDGFWVDDREGGWDIDFDELSDKITRGVLAVTNKPDEVEKAVSHIFDRMEITAGEGYGDHHVGYLRRYDADTKQAIALANNPTELRKLIEVKQVATK